MIPTYNFAGRRVLVTGGSRGLGRTIVEHFCKTGAKVVVIGQNELHLKKVKEELSNVETCQVDLRDWDATRKAVASVLPIHHLVNNAGILSPNPFLKITREQLVQVFKVNIRAAIIVTQIVVEGAIKSRLENMTIVNMSSIADSSALTGVATAYNSTKAAITMCKKSIAAELGEHKIRVNCVRPGVTPTDLVGDFPQDVLAAALPPYMQRIPGQYQVTKDDVAHAVVFLSSTASAGINGTPVVIDGGFGID